MPSYKEHQRKKTKGGNIITCLVLVPAVVCAIAFNSFLLGIIAVATLLFLTTKYTFRCPSCGESINLPSRRHELEKFNHCSNCGFDLNSEMPEQPDPTAERD